MLDPPHTRAIDRAASTNAPCTHVSALLQKSMRRNTLGRRCGIPAAAAAASISCWSLGPRLCLAKGRQRPQGGLEPPRVPNFTAADAIAAAAVSDLTTGAGDCCRRRPQQPCVQCAPHPLHAKSPALQVVSWMRCVVATEEGAARGTKGLNPDTMPANPPSAHPSRTRTERHPVVGVAWQREAVVLQQLGIGLGGGGAQIADAHLLTGGDALGAGG